MSSARGSAGLNGESRELSAETRSAQKEKGQDDGALLDSEDNMGHGSMGFYYCQ
jgi:hypothetical protein